MRTTAEAVEAILVEDLDTAGLASLEPFIETASQIVTDVCGTAGYSDAKMELIERWLSAHVYTLNHSPTVQSQSVDGASESYVGVSGQRLAQTRYGQMAMTIDTKGKLAALDKKIESGRIKIGTGYMGRISDKSDLYSTQSDMNMDL